MEAVDVKAASYMDATVLPLTFIVIGQSSIVSFSM